MNKITHLLTLCLFLIISQSSIGQELGYAVCIAKDGGLESNQLNIQLLKDLDQFGNKNLVVYRWGEEGLAFDNTSKFKEKPVEYAVFLKPKITTCNKLKPAIKTVVDTAGYITDAWFVMNYSANYYLKMINVKTGVISDINIIDHDVDKIKVTSKIRKPSQLHIEVKKYFGRKKSSYLDKNPKVYQAIERHLYKDYKNSISQRFSYNRDIVLGKVKYVVSGINSLLDESIFDVKIIKNGDDLVKNAEINGGTANGIEKHDLFDVYALNEVEGKKFITKVTYMTAEDVSENSTTCKKTFIQSKKKFSKNLQLFDKMYVVRKKSLALKILPTPEEDYMNLALELKNVKHARKIEQNILYLPSIRLLERKMDKELNMLRDLYKDERFMDYNMSALQDQRLGAKYLLTFNDKNVGLTDVATGELIAVNKEEGKRNWLFSGYSDMQAINMALMSISGKGIEVLKILKEKKGKVKRIMVFHPYGFSDGDKMDISIIKDEKVGGKTFKRKEFIANGYISHEDSSPNIGTMYIRKKGRKALYQALKNNEKLDFIYSIKRD